jgi:mycothiol synthase
MSDSPRSVEEWLPGLIDAARKADGAPPFSDGALVEYRTGARQLVGIDEVAAALTTETEAEFVVHPDARGRGLGARLLELILGSTASPVLIWAHGDHPAARALAASHGLTAVRELLHLANPEIAGRVARIETPDIGGRVARSSARIETPPAGLDTTASAAYSTTGFVTGRDEDAWVALNHRIFAHHPEQGSVTRADLEQLESEPWFDADDFLLLRAGGELIGYCWLKIEGELGEIYVLGISPDHQGEKLGGRLLDAGLTRMRERGIRRAHLYVEGDNEQALPLYYSRGFERDSIDIQYSSLH